MRYDTVTFSIIFCPGDKSLNINDSFALQCLKSAETSEASETEEIELSSLDDLKALRDAIDRFLRATGASGPRPYPMAAEP